MQILSSQKFTFYSTTNTHPLTNSTKREKLPSSVCYHQTSTTVCVVLISQHTIPCDSWQLATLEYYIVFSTNLWNHISILTIEWIKILHILLSFSPGMIQLPDLLTLRFCVLLGDWFMLLSARLFFGSYIREQRAWIAAARSWFVRCRNTMNDSSIVQGSDREEPSL